MPQPPDFHSSIEHSLAAARDYLAAAKFEEARAVLDEIARTSLDAPLLRARLAVQLAQAGDLQFAAHFLAIDWTVVDTTAANLAGAALLHLGLAEAARATLRHAAASDDLQDRGACLLNLARAEMCLGEAEASLSALTQCEALFAPLPTLWLLSKAEALLALGHVDDALAVLPDDPATPELVKARVMLLASASRHQDAADTLTHALAQDADNIELILLATELANVRGRTGEALAMIGKALEHDPDNIGLLARKATLVPTMMSSRLGRDAAEKALSLAEQADDPRLIAVAQTAMAHVLQGENNTDDAELAYRRALELDPVCIPAMAGLGHLILSNGDVEQAIALFRRVQAISPLQGWVHLIQARELPDDPSVLDQIERVALQPGLEGPVQTGLLFRLAMAWDRQKAYDKAFTFARKANDAARALLPYDPSQHRAKVDQIMARLSKAFADARKDWGNPSAVPVFIVGMPRSGTTLAEQILAGHSKVHGAGELSLSGEAITRLDMWEQKLGSRQSYPECVADLTRNDIESIAGQWLQKLQSHDGSAQCVIDKLPHNFEHVGLVKLLFPNARIFNCRREARDIAVSNYVTDFAAKFGGMGFAYDLGWIGEQIVDHDRLMAHWATLYPDTVMDVVYEETVADTEAQARRMIAFIGLDWEPDVLEFQSVERSVKTASSWQVRQPVYTSSKARWKNYEAHLGPLEEALAAIPPMPEPMAAPALPPGYFVQATALLGAQRAGDAEKVFNRILQIHPDHAAAHQFLGVAQMQLGKLEEACQSMRRSVRLLPVHATWFSNLAAAETACGNLAEAQAARAIASKLGGAPDPAPQPIGADSPSGLARLCNSLEAAERLPLSALQLRQGEQLKSLVAHHARHTPSFMRRLKAAGITPDRLDTVEGLCRLPPLKRADIQTLGADFFSSDVPKHHQPVFQVSTSGSTGEPVTVRKSRINQLSLLANTMRDHRWFKRDFSGRMAQIRPQFGQIFETENWGIPVNQDHASGRALAIPITLDIHEQSERLRAFKPQLLVVYPNNLSALLTVWEAAGVAIEGLLHVKTMGETVSDSLRERLRHLTGLEIEDGYSSEEVGYIAIQCAEGGLYHLLSESVLVEVLNDDDTPCATGETGRVVVTDLHNYASPMIRYEIGDHAEVGGPCPCGRTLPTLRRIMGRTRNLVRYPDGRRNWPLVGFHNFPPSARIRRYQVAQTGLASLELRVVADQPLTPDMISALQRVVCDAMAYPFDVHVVQFDREIPSSTNGKMEEFICLMND